MKVLIILNGNVIELILSQGENKCDCIQDRKKRRPVILLNRMQNFANFVNYYTTIVQLW